MDSLTSPLHPKLSQMAHALRFLAADAVEKAQSGHPGMPLGMADLASVLFTRHLKYDATAPHWPDRDRFVLSNGHGSMLLYGLLYLTGYETATLDELKRFRQAHSRAAGHPEHGYMAGIETTTGPLGQGIATAVGMALAERLLNAEFGDDVVDHRTWVFCGDGCLMEGISQEAISLAGHLKLARLTVIFDDNGTTIDGSTSIATSDDQRKRFEASNWATIAVDGHDAQAIDKALAAARASDRPTLIAARTQIGFGAPTKVGQSVVHGAPLGATELAGMREKLSWPYPAFETPAELLAAWREAGRRGSATRGMWETRHAALTADRRAEFDRRQSGVLPDGLEAAVAAAITELTANPEAIPIRQGSQKAVGILAKHLPELVGGSADLTGSVLSKPAEMAGLDKTSFTGRHIPYGVREHGMAAALNGLALHGGFLPYGGTYLTFSDYCRPAIRLAALMGIKVVFLFSHDSIGVGEDGPTHQPIEHLASLRAMPGLRVYRPADQVEALECWYDAIAGKGPSVMIVARQKVPQARLALREDMPVRRGAYVISAADGERDLTLLATGSEVSLAIAAQKLLEGKGLKAAVVSMPCWETFELESAHYRREVLGEAPLFAVEAASPFGWHRYVGDDRRIIGIDQFGFSGPGPQVYEEFGLTPAKIAQRVADNI
ncbi:transketolase [Aestuariivirga sp. YIM B02566]|uniref:Transketolase n=1 Tax=Taklimakanibacter albus TaxID=2800327 RepID=A0ACC5RAP8_9HYPH|nr:transketolase [Aestuariivirga sp. YIM B02566]MBK1869674.1 transketolase [Aestuariivirga sp. YIM B02566]